MWPIQTQDKLFHDGNGTTELGTVVTAEWLNDVQQALLMVLAAGGQTPAKGKHNLLRDAIERIVNNHTPAASATVAGVVKLNDTLSSQSTTEALTANQGKALADALGALGDEAFKQRGALGTRNLDDIKGGANFGIWHQTQDSAAATELNYPVQIAGSLLVLPAAYQGFQIYIPRYHRTLYIREVGSGSTFAGWRAINDIADDLVTASKYASLSARQGKNLQDNKVDKTITLTAGSGLTGGGTLAASRTLTLGTPGKITASTTNSVGTDTHTHEIDKASTSTPGVVKLNDTLSSQSTTEALTANQGRLLNNAKADKATTLAGYGLGDAIAVLTGTIADGGTIPLPAGFTQGQCKWFVSMASDNPSRTSWDIDENRSRVNYRFECTASAARVVNARMYWEGQGGSSGSVPSTANYLVIAYK